MKFYSTYDNDMYGIFFRVKQILHVYNILLLIILSKRD